MKVLFINNSGGGYADFVEVADGATIHTFFERHMQGQHAPDFLIRVNRQAVPNDYRLQESDRVSITPTKIHGA